MAASHATELLEARALIEPGLDAHTALLKGAGAAYQARKNEEQFQEPGVWFYTRNQLDTAGTWATRRS